MKKNGGITIFLSLLLAVILSLVLTVIEGARINAMRMQIECTTDLGLDSAFAEYNRQLLEQYDLFFIDATYGGEMPSFIRVEDHIKGYMSYNLDPSKELPVFFIRDWLSLSIENIQLEEVSLATDQNGTVMKRQAIDYVKDKVGISMIENLVQQLGDFQESDFLNNTLEEAQRENQKEIEGVKLPLEEVEEDKWEPVKWSNPADIVHSQKSKGILALVTSGEKKLSHKSFRLDLSLSQRNIAKGFGLSPNKEDVKGMTQELLFGEYLMEKYGTYLNPKKKSVLDYQIEYLLIGKNNDIENLKGVANKILLMRQVSNTVTLYSDTVKVAEADALALVISTGLMVPHLQPLVKNSLLLAWIYAESIGDVKELLRGGKVPLVKTTSQWQLSFQNMLTQGAESKNREFGLDGVDYERYLRILLGKLNADQKAIRAMDVIEMDIRLTQGNHNFRMDGCIDSLVAEILFVSRDGHKFSIRRRYEY